MAGIHFVAERNALQNIYFVFLCLCLPDFDPISEPLLNSLIRWVILYCL